MLAANGLGTVLSVMGLLHVRRIAVGDRTRSLYFCTCSGQNASRLLAALNLACAVALAAQIADRWLWSFLAATAMLAIYLPYVAVLTLVEALEDMLDQRRELRPAEVTAAAPTTWAAEAQVLSEARNRAAELGACRCVTCVIWFLERSVQLGAWLFEVREAKRQQEFGARIKWRR